MKVSILGVKIDDISMDQAISLVENWLEKGGKHYIVTPNPEFIMAAQEDREFKDILNKADLSIPDGVGLKLTGKIKNRVTGIDLMDGLIQKVIDNQWTIGLIGGFKGVATKAANNLRQKYPQIKIVYTDDGGKIDQNGEWVEGNRLVIPKMDLLFVGFGQVKQEKWIFKNLAHLNVKVAMGVGGAFDVLAGKVPRAPKWLRDLGLEWLFRLVIEPWRIKRQLSLVKFVFRALG